MRYIIRLLSLLPFFILASCGDEEPEKREFARFKSIEVLDIDETGATFRSQIESPDSLPLELVGFEWELIANNSTVELIKLSIDHVQNHFFEFRTETNFQVNGKYRVRAFVKSEKNTTYSSWKGFVSLGSVSSEISNFSPKMVTYLDTLTLIGKNFSKLTGYNQVKIGDFSCEVIHISDTMLRAIVPQESLKIESEVSVTILGSTSKAKEMLVLTPLELQTISPVSAKSYDTLSFIGSIGNNPKHTSVEIAGVSVEPMYYSTDLLKVIVPAGIDNAANITLNVGVQSVSVDYLEYLKPEIIDFSPKLITWNDIVTITGNNFSVNDRDIEAILSRTIYGEDVLCSIVSITSESISFEVSDLAIGSEQMSVNLKVAGHEFSIGEIEFRKPEIHSIEPSLVSFGDEIIVKANYFHPNNNYFRPIYYEQQVELETIGASEVKVIVPEYLAASADGSIEIEIGSGYANFHSNTSVLYIKPPEITEISPSSVSSLGDEIIIYGRNFSPYDENTRLFWDDKEIHISSVTNNEVRFKISFDHIKNDHISSPVKITVGNQEITSVKPVIFLIKDEWSYIRTGGSIRTHNYTFSNKILYFIPFSSSSRWGITYDLISESSGFIPETSFEGKYDVLSFIQGSRVFMGGGRASSLSDAANSDFWSYDMISRNWNQLSNVPFDTKNSTCFELNDKIYCTSSVSDTLYSYDHSNDNWSLNNLIPYAETDVDDEIATFIFNDQAYLIRKSVLYKYDFDQDSWINLGLRNTLADVSTVVTIDNDIFLLKLFSLYIYNLETDDSMLIEYPFGTFSDMWAGDDGFLYFNKGGSLGHTGRLDPNLL